MLAEAIELLEDAEEIVSNEAEQDQWNEAQLLAIADQIRQCKNELSALLEESASLRMRRKKGEEKSKGKRKAKSSRVCEPGQCLCLPWLSYKGGQPGSVCALPGCLTKAANLGCPGSTG